jgi:hypothetical protein
MKSTIATKEHGKVRGMFRIQIEENGEIVGNSGWRKNLITNLGFNQYIVSRLGTGLTGSQVSHAALGTGAAPAATDTTLSGEVSTNGSGSVVRAAVTAATSSNSKALVNTATFSSANSFLTASANISNIGLFGVSGPTTASGTLFAGNTYASSTLATNQNVNVTYQINFS